MLPQHTCRPAALLGISLALALAGTAAALADSAPPTPASATDYSELLAEMDRGAGPSVHQPSGVILWDISAAMIVQGDDGELKDVEAISFTPDSEGPWPALLLVPGYSTSARDWVDNGIAFASAGYFCVAVSQPGMGKTDGPADFVGPWTLKVLNTAFDWMKSLPRVDSQRLGVVGFSRGAMAASLLATSRSDIKAVVCGGGIYDFQAAFSEISSPMIRDNMVRETGGGEYGLVPAEAAARSSILRMDKLSGKLLILHGEADVNAPVSQAYLLRDKLLALGKVQAQSVEDWVPDIPESAAVADSRSALYGLPEFVEPDFLLITFPATAHGIGRTNFQQNTIEFLRRVLPWELSEEEKARLQQLIKITI